MTSEKTNFYKGKYEIDLSSGEISLPKDIIDSWDLRNLGPKGRPKSVYFNAQRMSKEYGNKHLRLFDPLITRTLMNHGAIDYSDFVQINNTSSEALKTRWEVNENGLLIPKELSDMFGEKKKIHLVGNDDYVEILGNEAIEEFERSHYYESDEKRNIHKLNFAYCF